MIWRSAFALASRGGANGRLSILIFHRVLREPAPLFPGEPFASQFATVIVKPRAGQRADTLATTLRRQVQQVDANLPLYFVDTPQKNLDGFVAPNRIIATMFSIFGLGAVVLASVGIYGVTSFAVSQRTQEFGVRMALGADRSSILRLVLRQGTRQVLV